MNVVILGCGRVGSTLASMMDTPDNKVSIIDTSSDSFRRLDPNFSGTTVVGNGVDEEILIRAGIKEADAFAATTDGDNRNIMASQIAKEIFHVKKVMCRIYDPIRQQTYSALGIDTFSPTTIGAQLFFDGLTGNSSSEQQGKQGRG